MERRMMYSFITSPSVVSSNVAGARNKRHHSSGWWIQTTLFAHSFRNSIMVADSREVIGRLIRDNISWWVYEVDTRNSRSAGSSNWLLVYGLSFSGFLATTRAQLAVTFEIRELKLIIAEFIPLSRSRRSHEPAGKGTYSSPNTLPHHQK